MNCVVVVIMEMVLLDSYLNVFFFPSFIDNFLPLCSLDA